MQQTPDGPILKAEEAIAVAALKQFDADSEPLMIGGEKLEGN